MKKLFVTVFPAFSILFATLSCVKDNDMQPMPLAGKWARVDDVQVTCEYICFDSGDFSRYVASKDNILVSDGLICGSSESDFELVGTLPYSVAGGKLSVGNEDFGEISVVKDTLWIGTLRYLRINGFSDNGQTISIVSQADCDYRAQILHIGYKVTIPVDGTGFLAASTVEWLRYISASDSEVLLEVDENNTGEERSAEIFLIYPGAGEVPLKVIQSYSPAEIETENSAVFCEYPGGNHSLAYSIGNPRKEGRLTVSCSDPWVSDIIVTDSKISFTVSESTTNRTAILYLEYPNAGTKSVYVVQAPLTDLSTSGTANCYIVSDIGAYRFPAVKGNGTESAGAVSSVGVLWESFGTSTAPENGDLIPEVFYENGMISFTTGADFIEGNAVIAAKDVSGTILWSWHIWMTDKPDDHVYNNGAGSMMDRNLGATYFAYGDAGALGLLYQWGRKDPFLGSSSVYGAIRAKSTLADWPVPVESGPFTGTIDYAVANPTTFITGSNSNNDWHYTEDGSPDKTLWQSEKTIYDPCPPGYRVPDGGINGVWSKAFGGYSSFSEDSYDAVNRGYNFGFSGKCSKKLSNSANICWYPSSGSILYTDGSLSHVGYFGEYWSCTAEGSKAYSFNVASDSNVIPSGFNIRAFGYAVRCLKE